MAGAVGRRGFLVFLGALAALGAASALDPDGYRKYLRLRDDLERLQAENHRIADANARLAREVRALRSDPAAIERAAREELRFVKPGEVVFRLDDGVGAP
jgi:cell division protein FtsB